MPKKQTTKLRLQNFEKLYINCIILKNQRLEGKNTVDPDETAYYEPSHLDLQCLKIQQLCLGLYGLTGCCCFSHISENSPIIVLPIPYKANVS